MKILLSSVVLFVLLGCGDNSFRTSFVGQEIYGLKYDSNNSSGSTDDGTFSYENGDELSFYVGEILLAKSKVKQNMTLFDLAGVEAPVKAVDVKKSLREGSLNRVINMALFLQTVDQDGDSSNGIEIPKELEALTKDVDLDFNTHPYTFSHAFELRKLMQEARKQGILKEDRRIVKPYVALDILYASLNLKPEVFVSDLDTYKYSYNDSNESRLIFDQYGDAIISSFEKNVSYVYDGLGRLESSLKNGTDFSSANTKNLFFYDDFMNLIKEEIYMDSSMTAQFDNRGNVFYSYQESNGSLILHQTKSQSYNLNNDFLAFNTKDLKYGLFEDRNVSYTYDEYGNAITYESSIVNRINRYRSGKSCWNSEYNSFGSKILEENDFNCDGIINSRTKYSYNENNLPIGSIHDSGADGVIDYNQTTVYNEDGTQEFTVFGLNEGTVGSYSFYKLDKYGNSLNVLLDYDADGVFEQNSTSTYTENGDIISYEIRAEEGLLVYLSTYKYDVLGNLLLVESIDKENHELLYRAIYTYDLEGNRLSSSVLRSGYDEYTEVLTYDTFGNQLTYEKHTKEGENTIKVEINNSYINTTKWISLSAFVREEWNLIARY